MEHQININHENLEPRLKNIDDKLNLILSKLNQSLDNDSRPEPPIEPELPIDKKEIILSKDDWSNLFITSTNILLEKNKIYKIPVYEKIFIRNDLNLDLNGSTLIFGKDYFNQWIETGESQLLFFLGRWNNKITIKNGKMYTGKLLEQVQPFYRTIFSNTTDKDQTGIIELIDIDTNMEYGLLYSGQQGSINQSDCLTAKAINVNFEGIMFQELKAPNGGGLFSYQRNCNLQQVDPITHIESKIKFLDNHTFQSSEPLVKVKNIFIEDGNSCNILFADNKTFYLPKTNELDNIKTIRPIPNAGDIIQLECFEVNGIKYLRTKEYELQAGDTININGINILLEVKDRAEYHHFRNDIPIGNPVGYWIDFKPSVQNISTGWNNATIIISSGLDIIGKELDGYLIFKYNRNFQTNVDVDHGLNYILSSDPFGVLSYNHKEITVDWENNVHNGFYRQSSSGRGYSNGYRLVNCKGYNDQFSPDIEITKI